MKNLKELLYICAAVLATVGVMMYINLCAEKNVINNIIFIPLLYIYYKSYKNLNGKRLIVYSSVISFILSIILVFGQQLETRSDIVWSFRTVLNVVLLSFSIMPIFEFIIKYIEKSYENKFNMDVKSEKKLFWQVFFILFVFGFLGFLALYPGQYGYDAGYQIMQLQYDDVGLTTHFSIVYSFILYEFVNIGSIIFNSYTIGFALYSFFQMTILVYITTKICMFIYNITKNKILFLITIVFFSVFPLHIIMMLSSNQDALFCGLLALLFIETYNLVIDSDKFFEKFRNIIKYILLLLLLFMLRNNGLYCIIPTILFIIIGMKKNKIKIISLYAIAIVLFVIYKGPIMNCIGAKDVDSLKEISSIPCQQLARTYIYNNDAFDENDEELLHKVFNSTEEELFQVYSIRPCISDSIKATINVDTAKDNINDLSKMYIKIGIKDPENYCEAFLLNTLGFWYPNKTYPDSRIYHPLIETQMLESKKYNERYIEINRQSKFPVYNNILTRLITENGVEKLPIISTLFTCGTYAIIFLFTCIFAVYKKEYKLLIPLSIILGYYATLLLSPVCIFRYCYGLLLCAPMCVALLFQEKK